MRYSFLHGDGESARFRLGLSTARDSLAVAEVNRGKPQTQFMPLQKEYPMKKTWTKPQISQQDVSLEVTAYVAAELKS